jgi:hypothetical protein
VVSEADRRRRRSLAASLEEVEMDEVPTPPALAAARAIADRFRAADGLPPIDDGRDLPEEELYRRARALGLRRSSR